MSRLQVETFLHWLKEMEEMSPNIFTNVIILFVQQCLHQT